MPCFFVFLKNKVEALELKSRSWFFGLEVGSLEIGPLVRGLIEFGSEGVQLPELGQLRSREEEERR